MTALSKQRSPWVWYETDPALTAVDSTMQTFVRKVNDGVLVAFVSLATGLWHLSISHRRPENAKSKRLAHRYPTWDEIADARYTLTPPDAEMAMILPPLHLYVDVHPSTFHLWQTRIEGDPA